MCVLQEWSPRCFDCFNTSPSREDPSLPLLGAQGLLLWCFIHLQLKIRARFCGRNKGNYELHGVLKSPTARATTRAGSNNPQTSTVLLLPSSRKDKGSQAQLKSWQEKRCLPLLLHVTELGKPWIAGQLCPSPQQPSVAACPSYFLDEGIISSLMSGAVLRGICGFLTGLGMDAE